MSDRLIGVWLLERAAHGDAAHPHGVLLLTPDGWFSMQIGSTVACAGHFGIDGDRFLLDPVVALAERDAGRVQEWRSSFDGDVLVLTAGDEQLRWHREHADIVTGLGAE